MINSHYQSFFQSFFGISKVDYIHYTPDKSGGIWLNLDWNSQYPGGKYIDFTKRTIFYPMEGYFVTVTEK